MAHDPDQLVELVVFEQEFVAVLLKDRLAESAISSEVFATATDGIGFISASTFPHGGAQVRVRRNDLDVARQILDAFRKEHVDANSDTDEE